MHDAVIDAAQRNHRAVREWRRLRQPAEPRRDPAAVLLGEFARLLQAAARRHGEHDFAGGGMDAQRVAARLPVAAHAHQIDLAIEGDADRRRLARPAVEQARAMACEGSARCRNRRGNIAIFAAVRHAVLRGRKCRNDARAYT